MADSTISSSSPTNLQDLLPSMAMRGDVRPKDIGNIIKNMVFVDIATKIIPAIVKAVDGVIKNRLGAKGKKLMENISASDSKTKKAAINFHRTYQNTDPNSNNHSNHASDNDTFDAIMWRVCQLPQTKFLKLTSNGVYVITNKDTITIDSDFNIKQHTTTFNDKNEVTDSCVELYSFTSDLIKMKAYITDLVHKYVLFRDNQLGQKLFYFDEIPMNIPLTIENTINFDMAPKHMSFMMSQLQSNKSMRNVYGSAMKTVIKRVKFFLENKSWYEDKGIPYTLGLLLHGDPGCGKTSLIKAISKDTERHVFNIKLSESSTVSQFNSLFFNERVTVIRDGQTHSYNIPIDKRIIVIEDIDCLSSIVMNRKTAPKPLKANNNGAPQPLHVMGGCDPNLQAQQNVLGGIAAWEDDSSSSFGLIGDTSSQQFDIHAFMGSASVIPKGPSASKPPTHEPTNKSSNVAAAGSSTPHIHAQQLTLSYILNILDGILETPGRIIIMTSNFPERLDEALIRPGRIDLKVHFTKCTIADITEMIEKIARRTGLSGISLGSTCNVIYQCARGNDVDRRNCGSDEP